jgi:hypothetical protein
MELTDLKHGHWYEVVDHPDLQIQNIFQHDAYHRETDPIILLKQRIPGGEDGKVRVKLDVFRYSQFLPYLVEVPMPEYARQACEKHPDAFLKPTETPEEGRLRHRKIAAEIEARMAEIRRLTEETYA